MSKVKMPERTEQKVIGFWKTRKPYGFMSQWYYSDFTDNGIKFDTCEKYMMYQKAKLFEDSYSASTILQVRAPSKIKKLGRKVEGFEEKKWDTTKEDIIYKANLLKFTQNEKLKIKLLNTKDDVLAEASPYDKIYGIGLYPEDKNVQIPSNWKGQNLLGKALMRVRREIREIREIRDTKEKT